MKNMRKTRIFQKDAYIAVDFLKKNVEIIRLKNVEEETDPLAVIIDLGQNKGKKQLFFEKPEVLPSNAIKTELEDFIESVNNNTEPAVTIYDGYNSLEIAYKIIENIEMSANFLME